MHVTKKVGLAAIAAASLIAISLPFAVVAGAQSTADQQGEQRGQGGQGGQGGFGQGGQGGQGGFQGGAIPAPGQGGRGGFGGGQSGFPGGMGGGGSSAMEIDNMFLYVLQGNTIFKVSKADLKIVGQTSLMPMGTPGQPGQGGRGGNGGGTK